MSISEPQVSVPPRAVGPSLTAAGLAAWVLSRNHDEARAAATRELQDALDAALRSGETGPVRVSRAVVDRAAVLWEDAAVLLESWSRAVDGDPESDRQAARLRARVGSLRRALATG